MIAPGLDLMRNRHKDRARARLVTWNKHLARSEAGFVTWNRYQDRSGAGFATLNMYQGPLQVPGTLRWQDRPVTGSETWHGTQQLAETCEGPHTETCK